MRLEGQRGSSNVEDRRGMSPMMKGGGLGCGGLIIVLVLSYLTGMDPRQLMQTTQQIAPPPQTQGEVGAPADEIQRPNRHVGVHGKDQLTVVQPHRRGVAHVVPRDARFDVAAQIPDVDVRRIVTRGGRDHRDHAVPLERGPAVEPDARDSRDREMDHQHVALLA